MSRRRGGLSPEDRDLWSRYARTTEPLNPAARPAPPASPPLRPPEAAPSSPAPVAPFAVGQRARPRDTVHALAPPLAAQVAAAPLSMDAKAHRRMKAGKLRPEGKLDLHGLTLDAAHPALVRFVLSAQAQGKRLVIVVTGIGKHRDEGGPIPTRLGVLRHQVPQWLRLPPLAGVVLQITQAHRSHGGAGAYYLYLRRG